MENKLSFERKISFEPLLISIFLGITIAAIAYSIFSKYPLIWIICGLIAFGIESMLIYPKYLLNSYGYWRIEDKGIYYYDYGTWNKKIQAIFFPSREKPVELLFGNINGFSIIDGKSIMNTQYPLGGTLRAPLARRIHYLVLETNQGQIKLNCAWKANGIPTTQDDIREIVELMNLRISQ
ncbi:hypothetical protein [Companilactobacillus halodurans]|uniref:Uncharacterized protein n=1 Tax=Companilactobacillus halodurans TaxID=2584183 RepID=A0A5P0ZY97_9LACO|nr:hypothetical protein [Companilactobacillus halodurans]MQS75721.1 hypothetical protein [Companilactobacillus halodurans]MQS98031.1 hypothetical protein [Companilactobacillus halodurans]